MSATDRPGWTDYYVGVAEAVARRADCTRAKVGAVIVADGRIISTGYNGSPPGAASCLAGHCPRGRQSVDELPRGGRYSTCYALHAERNAILYADQARLAGSTMFITRKPCDDCERLISAVGITEVFYPHDTEQLEAVA